MSRKSGRVKRIVSRFFKERQIYHRSDGVVHFISMSTKTQIALATVVGAALLWVAYASVNVVFKEQIIVAKERDSRIMELNYGRQLLQQQQAYSDVDTLNQVMEREYNATVAEFANRHDTLKQMVERNAAITGELEALSKELSNAGAPTGQKPANANRIMIDVIPAEPTPRQSRLSALRKEAVREARQRRSDFLPKNSPAQSKLDAMEQAAADLYVEQALLLAALEERTVEVAKNMKLVLASAGVNPSTLVSPAKIRNVTLAQGGPFIAAESADDYDVDFYKHANRASVLIDELASMKNIMESVPLSSPLTVRRRFTSGYGVRRDPINGRRSNHFGIDFAAAWRAPVTATANGVVKFAGVRSGFGRTVEIDHGNGFMTRYAHLHRHTVKRGQRVNLHDKIGELGSSGRSTGPHVHYEIIYKGKARNPQRFIEAGRYVFES